MSKAEVLAHSIADALEESEDARSELIALGMVVSGVICETEPEGRADLVDTFCKILRDSVANELN